MILNIFMCISHIVYNITNWYRFYLKFMYVLKWARSFLCREREQEEETKRRVRMGIHTSLNSLLYISYHLGAFFSIAVLFQNKKRSPFSIWPAKCYCCCLGKLYSIVAKRRKRKEKKNWKENFLFSLVLPYIKRHMNVFPLHFMWATHMYCCCLLVVFVGIRMNFFFFFILNFSFSHSIQGIRYIYVFLWPAP